MALNDSDRERVRYHLGYMTVIVATSFAFGIPQLTQTQFMVEDAMGRIMDASIPRVIRILDILDRIECKIEGTTSELFARRIDGIEPNLDQPDALEKEYCRWASRLADMLGCMPYPYSRRFKQMNQAGIRNVSVRS